MGQVEHKLNWKCSAASQIGNQGMLPSGGMRLWASKAKPRVAFPDLSTEAGAAHVALDSYQYLDGLYRNL